MPTFTDEEIKRNPEAAALAAEQVRINAIANPQQRAAEQTAFNQKAGIIEVAAGTTPGQATPQEILATMKAAGAPQADIDATARQLGISSGSTGGSAANALQNKSLQDAAIKGAKVAGAIGIGGLLLAGLYKLAKKVF